MLDKLREAMNSELGKNGGVWKILATGAFGVLIGALTPYVAGPPRDVVTKQDLTSALAPIQAQLSQLSSQGGANQAQIVLLQVDVARISEHLGIQKK